MYRLLLTISFVTIVFATFVAATPLTGIKTVGGANPDYATLNDATMAVTSWGVGPGGVTFNVRPGTYGDMLYVYPIAGSSADNPVIYRKESGSVTVSPTTTTYIEAAIKLYGCSYVTFDGIDIIDTSRGSCYLEYGYWITNYSTTQGASHNTIKNCRIQLRKDYSSYGICQSTLSQPTNASGSQSYNIYLNLKISKCRTGFCLVSNQTFPDYYTEIGSTSTDRNDPNRFTIGTLLNDTIGGTGSCYGIQSKYQFNMLIHDLDIQNLITTSTSNTGDCCGLSCDHNQSTIIHDVAIGNVHSNGRINSYGLSCYYQVNLTAYNIDISNITTVSNNGYSYSFGVSFNQVSGTASVSEFNVSTVTSLNAYMSYGMDYVNCDAAFTSSDITISGVSVNGAGSCYGMICNSLGNASFQRININNITSTISAGNIIGLSSGDCGGLSFQNSTIRNVISSGSVGTSYGFTTGNQNRMLLHDNEISDVHSSSGHAFGIYCNGYSNASPSKIYNNRVYNISAVHNSPYSDACGIYCITATNYKFFNNLIQNVQSVATTASLTSAIHAYGIFASTTTNANFDNNTVLMQQGIGDSTRCSSTAAAFSVVANNHDTLRNNILVNTTPNQTGTPNHYCLYTSGSLQYSNNNCFYLPNPTNGSIGLSGTTHCNLSSWQSLTHLDSNSVVGNPNFVSSTDLHIHTDIPTPVESRGVPVSYVTTDFDGNARNSTRPDIGADEGNFLFDYCQSEKITGTGGTTAWSPTFQNDPLTNNQPPIVVSFFANGSGSNPTQMSCRRDSRSNAIANWGLIQTEIDTVLPPANWINRIWDINQTGGVNYDADLTLHFTTADMNGLTRWQIQRIATKHGTNPWVISPCITTGPDANGVYSAIIHHVNNFSYWTLGSQIVLPVELTSFTATSGDTTVHLTWRVESETNNRLFRIYRSENRTTVGDVVKEIAGRGTSSEPKTYSWTDTRVENGRTYYYRLSDLSLDGVETFYPTQVSATPRIGNGDIIPDWYPLAQNYPNPFNSITKIRYQVAHDGFVSLKLFNLKGELVRTLAYESKSVGEYSIDVNLNGLPNGEYFYRLKTGSTNAVRKMVYLK